MTYLQKLGVFAFLDTLLNKLQCLLHVLRVNGILNLVVAAQKHRVIARAHRGGYRSRKVRSSLTFELDVILCSRHKTRIRRKATRVKES